MCGIAGYYLFDEPIRGTARLIRSLGVMGHRGPDDEGATFIDPDRNISRDFVTENSARNVEGCRQLDATTEFPHRICFGHRRFSIIDLSPAGHQPFWTDDGRVCVAFNGEIYNYVELREELVRQGLRFRSKSDTEVLALGYQAWGVDCFSRFNGFWAVSVYDADRRQVLLARDRLGKAPLYMTNDSRGLYWASEIKGLINLPDGLRLTVRDQAVIDWAKWRFRDVFHQTMYNEVHSLPSATYGWIGADGHLEETKYWHIPRSRTRASDMSIDDAAAGLRGLLDDAVRLRLRADVPVAVQLNGGTDSSAVLALAVNNAPSIHAYTVSFPGTDVDEEPYARQVVQRYRDKLDYTVFTLPDDDLLEHADAFVYLMGEPFHSPNMWLNHSMWKSISAQGIRVSLSGTGGDEVLAGYPWHYFYLYLRDLLAQGNIGRLFKELVLCSELRPGLLGSGYMIHAARVSPRLSRFGDALKELPARRDPLTMSDRIKARPRPSEEINQRMIDVITDWQMNYYLRNDHQNSMGVPQEIRIPFLDYRVVEFAFTLPMEYLIRDGWMKWLLRRAMDDSLPKEVAWRKNKMGYPFPLTSWLSQFQDRIFAIIEPLDCPYLNTNNLRDSYNLIRQSNPTYLWRLISLAMWWKRCIQGDHLMGISHI
jgi:asparagine synthase (glutamine-hydrolysing)